MEEKIKTKLYVLLEDYRVGVAFPCCCEKCKQRGENEIQIKKLKEHTTYLSLTEKEFFEENHILYKSFNIEDLFTFLTNKLVEKEKDYFIKNTFREEWRRANYRGVFI